MKSTGFPEARSFLTLLLISFGGLLLTSFGCKGPENPDGRENVSGKITLNGQPLMGLAGIRFDPVDGGDGGGKGQIKQGVYSITGYDAVKPGKYTVRIFASVDYDRKTGKLADNQILEGDAIAVDLVPAEFNSNSKIEFEVVKGKNNVFNYDVVTDFVPSMPKSSKGKGETK